MTLQIYTVAMQCYLLPYIKVTYTKMLNGNYEFIIGWLNREIVVSF